MAKEARGSGLLVLVSVLVLGTLTFMNAGRDYVQSLAGITHCKETVVASNRSKDRQLAVTTYIRQCGKGTAPVTHINLHAGDEQQIADATGLIRSGELYMEAGRHTIGVDWDDGHGVTLNVSGSGPLPRGPEFTVKSVAQVRIRRAQ